MSKEVFVYIWSGLSEKAEERKSALRERNIPVKMNKCGDGQYVSISVPQQFHDEAEDIVLRLFFKEIHSRDLAPPFWLLS